MESMSRTSYVKSGLMSCVYEHLKKLADTEFIESFKVVTSTRSELEYRIRIGNDFINIKLTSDEA